jgi:hypothetical protein
MSIKRYGFQEEEQLAKATGEVNFLLADAHFCPDVQFKPFRSPGSIFRDSDWLLDAAASYCQNLQSTKTLGPQQASSLTSLTSMLWVSRYCGRVGDLEVDLKPPEPPDALPNSPQSGH